MAGSGRGGARQVGPKYPKPKIMLIDVEGAVEPLREARFNVTEGTFGPVYRMRGSADKWVAEPGQGSLPGYAEQEVVIIDLCGVRRTDRMYDPPPALAGTVCSYCPGNFADFRASWARRYQPEADRILEHGGVFVVFSEARQERAYGLVANLLGTVDPSSRGVASNWDFLSMFGETQWRPTSDSGDEFLPGPGANTPVGRLLWRHLRDAKFRCTFPRYFNAEAVLATNKYGGTTAIHVQSRKGHVLLLPQLVDKTAFLLELLRDVLPDLCPALFPDAEGQRWIHKPPYELPSVLEKRKQARKVKERARRELAALRAAADKDREDRGYQYDLLRGQDKPLVGAVKKVLEQFGFQDVRDVDEWLRATGKGTMLREDLQVRDYSPLLVVEVKGINRMPGDAEATQVENHLVTCMREEDRTDVQGLTIINHQRHLEPLRRENRTVFREDLVKNAEIRDRGLMTAWDLFRLLRGFERNRWKPDHVKPVFYGTGRIDPVPAHYEYLGTVVRLIKKLGVFGVTLEPERELCPGDRIAIETPVEFVEQKVASLQVDGQDVEVARAGDTPGIAPLFPKRVMRMGARVFRVRPE